MKYNFTLNEFVGSLTLTQIKKLPFEHLDNLFRLVQIMNIIRCHTYLPIRITSGYRTEKHNAKVGGVPTSEHLTGSACDWQFILDDKKDYDVCQEEEIDNIVEWIKDNVYYGQLIHYDNFVHISLPSPRHSLEYIDRRYLTSIKNKEIPHYS